MALQLTASLAAVLFLVFLAWRLGLGDEARIADEAEARELADEALCGFDAEAVGLDRAKRGALLRDRTGRVVLLAPHGSRVVGRLLDGRTRVECDGDRITIATGERTLAPVTLDIADASAWCRAIEGVG